MENSYRYDAFGNLLEREETVPNRILYTGQQYDQETGQYYLRARYYNPVVGRFLQEDTYHGDGLNLYAYCANNPVVYYDPGGHDSAAVMKKAEEPDLPVGVGKGELEYDEVTNSLKERFPYWYDANGKYTGGRNQEALDALAFDPHKGKITSGSQIERDIILDLEEQGYIEHAVRDTWGKGDFFDDIMLKSYDIKSFESFPLDKFGNPIFSVNGGAFEVNTAMKNIRKEFTDNGIDFVIINTRKMEPIHISQLKDMIETEGLSERIIWY